MITRRNFNFLSLSSWFLLMGLPKAVTTISYPETPKENPLDVKLSDPVDPQNNATYELLDPDGKVVAQGRCSFKAEDLERNLLNHFYDGDGIFSLSVPIEHHFTKSAVVDSIRIRLDGWEDNPVLKRFGQRYFLFSGDSIKAVSL